MKPFPLPAELDLRTIEYRDWRAVPAQTKPRWKTPVKMWKVEGPVPSLGIWMFKVNPLYNHYVIRLKEGRKWAGHVGVTGLRHKGEQVFVVGNSWLPPHLRRTGLGSLMYIAARQAVEAYEFKSIKMISTSEHLSGTGTSPMAQKVWNRLRGEGRLNRRGQRAHHNRIVDDYTGEPLPPRTGKGRPRKFWMNRPSTHANPSDTKRAQALWNAFTRAQEVVLKEHMLTPRAASELSAQALSEHNKLRSQMRVCDGTMRLADNVAPGALYTPKSVVCDGEIRTLNSYYQVEAQRTAAKIRRAVARELGREPTKDEVKEAMDLYKKWRKDRPGVSRKEARLVRTRLLG